MITLFRWMLTARFPLSATSVSDQLQTNPLRFASPRRSHTRRHSITSLPTIQLRGAVLTMASVWILAPALLAAEPPTPPDLDPQGARPSAFEPVSPTSSDAELSGCVVPTGVIVSTCDDEMWHFITSAGICLVSAVGFVKAAKTVKAAAAAVKSGASVSGVIWGALGAFFCTDAYTTFWEWQDCQTELADYGWLDGTIDPRLTQRSRYELAEALEEYAARLERGVAMIGPPR